MKRVFASIVAGVTIGLAVNVAVVDVADAAPSRVGCEQAATAAANGSGYVHGSVGWNLVHALAYAKCLQGQPMPDYRLPMPKRWTPTLIGWFYLPAWVLS